MLRKAAKSKDVSPTGRIVAIVRRKWRQYCGILQPNPVAGSVRQIFVPAEKKIPKIRIETRQMDTLAGQRIIVAVDAWPRTSRYPVKMGTTFERFRGSKNIHVKFFRYDVSLTAHRWPV